MPHVLGPFTVGTIRYVGVFDFDGLYEGIVEWFKRYRYQFFDSSYKHKVPSPYGAEQELDWYGEKNETDFVKFRIDITVHIWEMTDVEVIQNNKKKVLTKGRMQIKLTGRVIFDWQDKFEKTWFTRMLRDIWVKWLWRREVISIGGDPLTYRMYDLHAYIKKYLDMQTSAHHYKGYLGEDR